MQNTPKLIYWISSFNTICKLSGFLLFSNSGQRLKLSTLLTRKFSMSHHSRWEGNNYYFTVTSNSKRIYITHVPPFMSIVASEDKITITSQKTWLVKSAFHASDITTRIFLCHVYALQSHSKLDIVDCTYLNKCSYVWIFMRFVSMSTSTDRFCYIRALAVNNRQGIYEIRYKDISRHDIPSRYSIFNFVKSK